MRSIYDKKMKQQLNFEVLDVLEFTSARRRMSVVIRDTRTGAVTLLTKGADSVMLKLLAPGQDEIVRKTEQHMIDHSNDGLRTLVIACKQLRESDYKQWRLNYRAALTNIEELEKKGRDEPNAIDRPASALST